MLTKTSKPQTYKVEEVIFNHISEWPPNYRDALGALLISCSQWEYVYELLWKDMNPNPAKPFIEVMKDADKEVSFVQKNILDPLAKYGDKETQEIAKLVSELEASFKDLRHLMVHGFHHQHSDNILVTRLSHRGNDIVGETFNPDKVLEAANKINQTIPKINELRRTKFHAGANAFGVSAATN